MPVAETRDPYHGCVLEEGEPMPTLELTALLEREYEKHYKYRAED